MWNYPKPGDDGFAASLASSFCPLACDDEDFNEISKQTRCDDEDFNEISKQTRSAALYY